VRRGGNLHTARAVAACFAWVEEDAGGEKKCRGRWREGAGVAKNAGLFVRARGSYFGFVAVLGKRAKVPRMKKVKNNSNLFPSAPVLVYRGYERS
jgi:hypothetical protein